VDGAAVAAPAGGAVPSVVVEASVVSAAGGCVEPGASATGSVPTPVSVVAGADAAAAAAVTGCGVPVSSVVTVALPTAPASAFAAGADANGPVLVAGIVRGAAAAAACFFGANEYDVRATGTALCVR
jgi:hypothetical protein